MSNQQIKVRLATLEDAPILADFAIRMAKETENKDLDCETVNNGIRNCLLNPAYGKYCVASVGDSSDVIGCLMITFEMSA